MNHNSKNGSLPAIFLERFSDVLSPLFFMMLIPCLLVSFAYAENADNEWLTEFEDICMMVKVADSLTIDEIKKLIERSDKLLPLIEASANKRKKLYVFRLKKCRSFFEYMLELKELGRR